MPSAHVKTCGRLFAPCKRPQQVRRLGLKKQLQDQTATTNTLASDDLDINIRLGGKLV